MSTPEEFENDFTDEADDNIFPENDVFDPQEEDQINSSLGELYDFDLQELIKYSNRTHYLKWVLHNDISVRYHEVFQDKPELVGKYILKDHETNTFQVLSNKMARAIIDGGNTKDYTEIYGYLQNKEYHKLIKHNNQWYHRNESDLDKFHEKRLQQKNWKQEEEKFIRQIDLKTFTLYYESSYFVLTASFKGQSKSIWEYYLYDEAINKLKEQVNIKKDLVFAPTEEMLIEAYNTHTKEK